jgi:hypothetical protein
MYFFSPIVLERDYLFCSDKSPIGYIVVSAACFLPELWQSFWSYLSRLLMLGTFIVSALVFDNKPYFLLHKDLAELMFLVLPNHWNSFIFQEGMKEEKAFL